MMIELKCAVLVHHPAGHFVQIESGRRVNYSSDKKPGDIWIHRFSAMDKKTDIIVQYAETIQGRGGPPWL